MENKPQAKLTFVLLIALALVVIAESVYIIEQLTPRSFLPQVVQRVVQPTKTPEGKMSLSLEEGQTAQVGVDLNAKLIISAQEPIASADVILEFNPQLVAISRITGNKNMFEQILVNQQDEAEGKIKITAYLPKKTIEEEEILATITFRLLRDQPAEIKIGFAGANETTDSNLVSQASLKDILAQVESLQLKP